MRKLKRSIHSPGKQSSEKKLKQTDALVNPKRFDAYNNASKAKAESAGNLKPLPAFEYYYDEYDEYLSS